MCFTVRMCSLGMVSCTTRKALQLCGVRLSSSASKPLVSVTRNEETKTATVVLQSPPVNSLNLELLQEIKAAVKNVEKEKLRGFILTSSSPTVFSAGIDITEVYQAKEERLRTVWRALQEAWKALYSTPLYTVAAVNGHAPGAGCMLAMSCDYSVMVNSKGLIGVNESKLGIMVPRWFQKLLVNAAGFKSASKALNLGILWTPQEALSLNIVDELAGNSAQLMEQARKQLELGIQIPAIARSSTKHAMRSPHVQELSTYADQEIDEVIKLILSDEVQAVLEVYWNNLKKKSAK